MTVNAETNKVTYAGDGATASFSTSFTFSADGEVTVTLVDSDGNETEWTDGTQYTLTGAATGVAGTLTVDTSPTDYTPASGETLVIELKPATTQTTALPRGGTLSPKATLEPMFDKATRQILYLKGLLDNALKAPITETTTIGRLPTKTDRASKYLTFDASGDPSAAAAPADTTAVTAFMATVLDDATAAAARTTLGAGVGDVVGPSSATNNAIVRYDATTGKLLQDSGVLIDDDDNMSGHGAEINAQTGTTYTLVGTDNGKVVTLNNGSAITLTLPQTSTETIAAGFQCTIIQLGAGQVTVAKEGSDNLLSKGGNVALTGQYSPATIVKNVAGSPNTYVLMGDLA